MAVPAPLDNEAPLDALRLRLAETGVPLFVRAACTRPLDDDAAANLLVGLVRSGDPRLVASIPAALVACRTVPQSAAIAAARLSADEARRFGLLHGVARCLAASRGHDLATAFGAVAALPATHGEPHDLPPPEDSFGEAGLRAAADRERGLVGDAIDLFDQWLRALRNERRAREPASRR